MKVAVYDTHVTKKNGQPMHFDVIVPETETVDRVFGFGREFLKNAGQEGQPLSAQECQFCHHEPAKPQVEQSIKQHGYYIQKMEGCR